MFCKGPPPHFIGKRLLLSMCACAILTSNCHFSKPIFRKWQVFWNVATQKKIYWFIFLILLQKISRFHPLMIWYLVPRLSWPLLIVFGSQHTFLDASCGISALGADLQTAGPFQGFFKISENWIFAPLYGN